MGNPYPYRVCFVRLFFRGMHKWTVQPDHIDVVSKSAGHQWVRQVNDNIRLDYVVVWHSVVSNNQPTTARL